MPSSDPARRFRDILENITRIEAYTAGLDRPAFRADGRTIDAVKRCLSRISEGATKLGADAELLCPGLPWPDIRGLGNRLRHEYAGINPDRIWLIVEDDLSALRNDCEAALARLEGNPPPQA